MTRDAIAQALDDDVLLKLLGKACANQVWVFPEACETLRAGILAALPPETPMRVNVRDDGATDAHMEQPETPAPTCATCQWWAEQIQPDGTGTRLGYGRCFKGVRIGNPMRQSPDVGIYTPREFYCNLHEGQPREGEP